MPICSGRQVLTGFNDLATTAPGIAANWHSTLNGPLLPEHVTAGSDRRAWWSGTCGHEWDAVISSRCRAASETGCPVCRGLRVLPGFNDLASRDAAVAAEWHPTKNGDLTPTDVTVGSSKAAWWLGAHCGHEWRVRVDARTGRDRNGCPKCATSYVERALVDALRSLGLDVEHDVRLPVPWGKAKTARVDMTVTGLGPAVAVVEYDGQFWHRSKQAQDTEKTTALLAAGHPVVRVREGDLGRLDLEHPSLRQVVRPLRTDVSVTARDVSTTLDEISRPQRS